MHAILLNGPYMCVSRRLMILMLENIAPPRPLWPRRRVRWCVSTVVSAEVEVCVLCVCGARQGDRAAGVARVCCVRVLRGVRSVCVMCVCAM